MFQFQYVSHFEKKKNAGILSGTVSISIIFDCIDKLNFGGKSSNEVYLKMAIKTNKANSVKLAKTYPIQKQKQFY